MIDELFDDTATERRMNAQMRPQPLPEIPLTPKTRALFAGASKVGDLAERYKGAGTDEASRQDVTAGVPRGIGKTVAAVNVAEGPKVQGNGLWRCPDCSREFGKEQAAKVHMLRSHGKRVVHMCERCHDVEVPNDHHGGTQRKYCDACREIVYAENAAKNTGRGVGESDANDSDSITPQVTEAESVKHEGQSQASDSSTCQQVAKEEVGSGYVYVADLDAALEQSSRERLIDKLDLLALTIGLAVAEKRIEESIVPHIRRRLADLRETIDPTWTRPENRAVTS